MNKNNEFLELFKKNKDEFTKKALKSVFEGLGITNLDLTFLEFLRAFKVEGASDDINAMQNPDFHSFAAKEIVRQLITENQQEKLKNLMNELRKKDFDFVDNVLCKIREDELRENEGTVSRKIFKQVEVEVSDSLILLALIKVDQDDFQESRKFLTEMWYSLPEIPDIKSEEGKEKARQKVRENAQNAFSKALDELEKFVNSVESEEEVNDSTNQEQSQEKAEEDSQNKKYCETKYEVIKKELKRYSVKESDLDADIKNELAKLKKGGISRNEINEIKNRVSNNIKLKKVEKELNNLLKSYQENLSSKEKKRLLNKIHDFINKKSSFYKQVYQKRKKEIEELKNRLEVESLSQQTLPNKENFVLTVKSTIAIYLLTSAVIVFKKIKKNN